MPTSAVGSKSKRRVAQPSRGFTLLELMVVVAIVAMATVGVTLALRDTAQAQLETEGLRLAALLDAARAHSRASGVPVRWRPTAQGFQFEGLEPPNHSNSAALPTGWQSGGIAASVEHPLLLGPEPVLAPQQVKLWRTDQPDKAIWLVTDGVRPFGMQYSPR